MYDSDLYRRIRAGLDDIRILDTHEHLTLPYQLAEIGGDYLKVVDHYFDKFAAKASAYKIVRAYNRPIYFADVDFATAEKAFADRGRAVEDYVIHHCLKRAGEHNLPVKIHTGIQDGNCNNVTNSRPSLLINLFVKYPNVKFDIYHASWPYSDELMAIAKQFPNVWVDFCWLWIISPTAARGCLSEMLETVPLNKIHGFGGDFFFVEGSYGHAMIARREIARVLAEKVQEGRFTEEYAAWVAHRLLRENALENFRVEEKRGI